MEEAILSVRELSESIKTISLSGSISIEKNILVSLIPEPLALIIVPPLEPTFVAASITHSHLPLSTTAIITLYIGFFTSLFSLSILHVWLLVPNILLIEVLKAIP